MSMNCRLIGRACLEAGECLADLDDEAYVTM
jgi:hypothetical protein